MRRQNVPLPVALGSAFVLSIVLLLPGATAAAAPAGPGWTIRSLAQPTNLSSAHNAACGPGGESQACNNYTLIVTNVGGHAVPAGGHVTIADTLPAGVHVVSIISSVPLTGGGMGCTKVPLQCVDEAEVPVGETLLMTIDVTVDKALEEAGTRSVPNSASVSGGGAPAVAISEQTPVASEPAPFEIADFALQAFDSSGAPSTQAGGRPYALATSLDFTSENESRVELGGVNYRPPEEVRDVIADLPPGLVGNPQSTPRCPVYALLKNDEETTCPAGSRIGTIVFEASPGVFAASEGLHSLTTAVYNMVPEPGFPAEFGFTYIGKAVFMYASSVRIGNSYRLRVTVPGIPKLQMIGVTLLFFGDSGERFGGLSSPTRFFTNPVDCAAGPLTASVEVDTWRHPGVYHTKESTTYPQLTGCNMLQFQPTLSVAPDTTQADEPAGYTFTVASPQNESPFTPGTPELKDATVTLPAGVSISPSAADGLNGCAATGADGINIGSGATGSTGVDISDPEATELGAGHTEGNGSPYDDGLYHTAPGHCPAASMIGTAEVETPLVPSPLQGHVYVALPGCGGSGQAPCTSEDAVNGTLFGAYLEVAGSGAIVKLAGSVSIDPSTGQITASFRENPQVPFSAFRLHFHGGPRAVLANPQACGQATTTADLSAWSSPATLDSLALPYFTVDWDDAGGACPATLPLTPSLIAETTNPTAGAFSPFTFTLSRGDRQQYLSRISVTTPPGLLGMLSTVPLCGEPQARQGSCPEASRIGTVNTAAGPGSHPLWVSGRVYLTVGYNGAPFGLSIVVPAEAGPFHLGDVVVRSAITADENTSALTITSDPLPQIIDGVPLRVQTVNVTVDRPGFMFNPTNCGAKQISATVAGAQGALAHVSIPFAAAGCRGLPFSPSFTASTSARSSKRYGASFDVKVLYKPGQANIRSVSVRLPKQLPARLTTIQQACLVATFEANPATCPAGSLIGIAKARTPVLPVALEGPVYLVSHGGAAFPDVVVVVQGDGVRVDLTGNINIAKGITTSTFASVPDAPITSFELKLPLSTHSALTTNLPAAARGGLCGTKLTMPTTLTAQNGLQIKQSTKIAVTGCPKVKKKAKKASARSRGGRAGAAGRRGARGGTGR
jgi:hypothetical protein